MAKPRITLATPYDSTGTLVFRCQKSRRNSNDITLTGAPNRGGVGSNREISTTEQLCRSDAVPPQHCVHPPWSTPTTRLRWRSDIGLLLSTTSGRSLLRLLCLFQLKVCSHGSVCISRASCFNPIITRYKQEALLMQRNRASTLSVETVTVTVTNKFILRLLLEDRGRITEPSARSLVSVNRLKQKCFQLAAEEVGRLQLFQPLFHARGAVTEKARSPICRRVRAV